MGRESSLEALESTALFFFYPEENVDVWAFGTKGRS